MSWPPAFLHWAQKQPITKVKVFVLTMFFKVKNHTCGGILEVSNQEDTLLTSSKTDALCRQVMWSCQYCSVV